MARFLISPGSRLPFKWMIICLLMVYAINVGYGVGLYSKSAGLTLMAIDLSLMMGMIIRRLVKK